MQWPWPRWVDVMTSAGPSGQHAPTADASWPVDKCTKPGTSPARYSAATRSSNPRIVSIRRCISRRSASVNMNRYCTYWSVQTKGQARKTMPDQIDIPASFAGAADVTGKRVVITGASRGLGRWLAYAFSQGGARVTLVARTETDLKAVAAELPGPSLVLSGDVTDEEFNEAVADATVAEWGGVDVWICNAGISPIVAGPVETDPSVWRAVLEVNLTGAFLGARAAARVMPEGGRLIFPRSSRVPCSTSTAATCSYERASASRVSRLAASVARVARRAEGAQGAEMMTDPRRVVAITGAGGALGAALSSRFAGEPDTGLVL